MATYRPQVGDRVRVVTEGVVTRAGETDYFRIGDSEIWASDPGVSIEKVEPPVEVFGPGEVVRDKRLRQFTFAIGKSGYFDLSNAIWFSGPTDPFTSQDYERVVLS